MRNKTVAIYIRLSMADEMTDFGKVESESIGNQRMYIHRFLDEHHELKEGVRTEFVDDGYTATNGNRPQFTKMIEKVQNGEIKVICVKDFSRFFRNYMEAGNYLERVFPLFGVRFISVNDHYDSDDYKGTTGGMEMVMRNIIYASYSKDLSVKVKCAKKLMMEQGKYMGGHPIYGYQLDPTNKYKLVVDEEAAKIVRTIFDMAIAGKSTGQIAEYLNLNQVPTRGQYFHTQNQKSNKYKATTKSSVWGIGSVREILKNYIYTGSMVSGKRSRIIVGSPKTKSTDAIIVENTHESIVTKEEYEQVKRNICSHRAKAHRTETMYPLKGMIRCAHCQRIMEKRPRRNTSDIYMCKYTVHNVHSECSKTQYSEERLEELIYEAIQQNIFHFIDKEEKKEENVKEKPHREKNIAHLKQSKLRMYELYVEGKMGREMYLENKRMVDIEIEALQENNIDCSKEEKQEVRSNCKAFSKEEKLTREMMIAFVNTVYVSETGIEIEWKFRDIFFSP